MKKTGPLATIIIGFIAGLAISGVLGDLIVFANNSAGRVSAALSVSRAEKLIAGGNFEQAAYQYRKALKKINPENKKLTAKTKNNLGICVFTVAEQKRDTEGVKEAILIFLESLEIYKEMSDAESVKQVETNIFEAKEFLKTLIPNS